MYYLLKDLVELTRGIDVPTGKQCEAYNSKHY